ncbi:MAG TPA: PEGA domain-containing protein [Polyangiaceae bacterium]|nr:PEGA domain-containing protein [Polyangiaceae bacterium]
MQFRLKATLLAAFLLVSHAHAAEPSEAELQQRREDAAQRYEQGVQAYQEGRHKDAIDLFLEADALAPSSALSFNIARAYEKIKDSSNALRWYRDYLRREPQADDRAAVSALIDDYEKVLEAKGLQQLTVLSEPETATVRVDGRPVGVTPWTGDVPPGTHTVSLSLRGYADVERQIALAADSAQDVAFRLQPATEAPPTPAPVPGAPPASGAAASPVAPSDAANTAEAPGVGVLTYVVLGAGVATLGAAGAFELMRSSAEEDAKNAKTQIEKSDALDTMDSRQTTARVLLGIGGALTVAGGVLLALDLTQAPETSAATRAKPGPELAASGACTFSNCFVSLQGSF